MWLRSTSSPVQQGQLEDLIAINRWLSASRLRSATGFALFCLLLEEIRPATINLSGILAVCAVAMSSSLYLSRSERPVAHPQTFFWLQNLLDTTLITVGIFVGAAGGFTAIVFRAIYVLLIVPVSLHSTPSGVVIATLASIAHLLLLFLDRGFAWSTLLTVDATVPIFLFYAVSHQCVFYAARVQEKNRRLENLTESLQRSEQKLSGLVDVARTLNSSPDPLAVLNRVNEAALKHLEADWAGTFLVDASTRTFRPAARSTRLVEGVEDLHTDLPLDALPPLADLETEPLIRLGPDEMAQYPTLRIGDGEPLTHFLVAGLYRDGDPKGFLALGYRDSREDKALAASIELASIVEHATVALRNTQLLEEAQQASQLKSDFLSTISHELRTPLNVILGYNDMLREGAAGTLTRQQQELFDRIDLQARDLYDLIEATLEVGRMTTRHGVQKTCVPLSSLIESIETATARLPLRDGVELIWDLPELNSGSIETDQAKVRLAVRNLLSNAFKFTERGSVTVTIRPDGRQLLIQVADTGIGIDPKHFGRIFEIFSQVESDDPRYPGVGLGLYIVKQIVDRLGGTVELDSTPGEGTTFTLRLPGYSPGSSAALRGVA